MLEVAFHLFGRSEKTILSLISLNAQREIKRCHPPTANSQQPTANRQQLAASSQQPTANSQQPTANSQQLTPTASSQLLNQRKRHFANCITTRNRNGHTLERHISLDNMTVSRYKKGTGR